MATKRWVGLRSPSFRKTALVLALILIFALGVLLGRRQQAADSKKIELLQQRVKALEQQVDKLQRNTGSM